MVSREVSTTTEMPSRKQPSTTKNTVSTTISMVAESWTVDKADPRIWTFNLRKGLKRHGDGKELTSEDVVHSMNRMANDPQTRQKQNVKNVKSATAVDKYTVKVVTDKPTAPLLEFLFDRVMVTGKDLFYKHGARDADR